MGLEDRDDPRQPGEAIPLRAVPLAVLVHRHGRRRIDDGVPAALGGRQMDVDRALDGPRGDVAHLAVDAPGDLPELAVEEDPIVELAPPPMEVVVTDQEPGLGKAARNTGPSTAILEAHPEGIRPPDIAARMAVAVRTVYRDLTRAPGRAPAPGLGRERGVGDRRRRRPSCRRSS